MNSAIQTTLSKEERKKLQIRDSIARKQKILEKKIEKVELLKEELSLIEHEYSVRIGSLLEKDNKLDLEIMQQKNLNEHLNNGLSFEEALKKDRDAFYNDIFTKEEESEQAKEQITMIGKNMPKKTLLQIKTLWKKLIVKFHPDLVTDKEEKARREDIVKKLNKAYRDHDLETLKAFENNLVDNIEEQTLEQLEILLIDIENMIQKVDAQLQKLKESEWFSWKEKLKKAKKKNEDVFSELEKNLINSILQKIKILREQKETTQRHQSEVVQ